MILTRTNFGSEGVNPKVSCKHFQNCLLMLDKTKKRSSRGVIRLIVLLWTISAMTIYSAYNIHYSSKLRHLLTAIFAEN